MVSYTTKSPSSTPGQGTADIEVNVDELMRRKLVEMRGQLEPYAVDNSSGYQTTTEMMLTSIAISLKRLADNGMVDQSYHSQMTGGLNSLCAIMDKIGNTLKPINENIVQALYGLSNEVRNNDGRELKIIISKD